MLGHRISSNVATSSISRTLARSATTGALPVLEPEITSDAVSDCTNHIHQAVLGRGSREATSRDGKVANNGNVARVDSRNLAKSSPVDEL